jgi:hypothetical protein
MRGYLRYLRFKTFPMTPRTPQCELFWALMSNPKHSGILEDSKSPTLGVLGFTPTLGQNGVATTLRTCYLALCRSVWVIKCLSFFLVPSRSSNTPFYPQSAMSQKMCPNSLFFRCFTSNSHLSLSRSLGVRQSHYIIFFYDLFFLFEFYVICNVCVVSWF